jgi:predicted amidohydrolase
MACIGFVQSSPVFGDPAANRERLLDQAARIEADLIVLPELCHSGYVFRWLGELDQLAEPIPDGPTCQALLDLARRRGAVIVAGICERAGQRFFNSAAVLARGAARHLSQDPPQGREALVRPGTTRRRCSRPGACGSG